MARSFLLRLRGSLLVATAIAVAPVAAAEAGKLLPDESDIVLTLNVRQMLADQKDSEFLQRHLRPCRLAPAIESFRDALGVDLLRDIDRITCAFRSRDPGAVAIVVEGRFNPKKLPVAVKQLAKELSGTARPRQIGDCEVWQVGDDGPNLVLLKDSTLAITCRTKSMDELLARAAGKKGGLSAAMQTLLDKGRKEHVLVVVGAVNLLIQDAVKLLKEEIARAEGPGKVIGQMVADQAAAAARKYGDELSAASLGVSFAAEDLRVQWGAVTKRAEAAGEMRAWVIRGNLLGALALKALDSEPARQLADVLLRVRVTGSDAVIVVRAEVPYEAIVEILQTWARTWSRGDSLMETVSRRIMSIPLWGPPKAPPGALEVEEVRDIAYCGDQAAATFRHQLDLFVPKGKKGFPIVVLVHGGNWIVGDNRCCGLYSTLGHFLASQGIGAVLPNYRLSPAVKHPEHVKDLARAVRWTHDNLAKYGGNTERIFLMGHSAGGHLVSLLATDESYLKAEGLKTADIKGVIAVSGVFHIPPGSEEFGLGGSGPQAFDLKQVYPLRGEGSLPSLALVSIPLKLDLYAPVFGDDAKEREKASPVAHVHRGLPPFLILTAEDDLPTLSGMGEEFHRALREKGCNARLLEVPHRNHIAIMFSAITPDDPAARAILEFLRREDR
jgi:acetyl esterase/lipase